MLKIPSGEKSNEWIKSPPGASLNVVHKSSQCQRVLTAVALQRSSSIGLGLFESDLVGLGLLDPLRIPDSPAEPQSSGLVTPWACGSLAWPLRGSWLLGKVNLRWPDTLGSMVSGSLAIFGPSATLRTPSWSECDEGSLIFFRFISLLFSDRTSLVSVVRLSKVFSVFVLSVSMLVVVVGPQFSDNLEPLFGCGCFWGCFGWERGSHK